MPQADDQHAPDPFAGFPSYGAINAQTARAAIRDLASPGDLMSLMASCQAVPGNCSSG
jgi:hypothetical protein